MSDPALPARPNRLSLDTRAAELKEKLLRSRGLGSQKPQPSPASSTQLSSPRPPPPGKAETPQKLQANLNPSLNPRPSGVNGTKPSPAHETSGPQTNAKTLTPQTTLEADSNDIADLITSIASTITDTRSPAGIKAKYPQPSKPERGQPVKQNKPLPDDVGLPTPISPFPKRLSSASEPRPTVSVAAPDNITDNNVSGENGKPSRAPNGTADTALRRVVGEFPDLKDWLLMTNYYDIESRTKKLDRYRKVRALDLEKQRIEEEQRKLLEEEEMELDLRRTTSAVNFKTAPLPAAEPKSGPKREYPENDREQGGRAEKQPRLAGSEFRPRSRDDGRYKNDNGRNKENYPGPRHDTRHYEIRYDVEHRGTHQRPPSPYRGFSPRRYPESPPRWERRRSPSPRPHSRGYSPHHRPHYDPRHRPDFDGRSEKRYDSYRGDSSRRDSRFGVPTPVDFGGKGG